MRVIEELEGGKVQHIERYIDDTTKEYANMVELIRRRVGVDTLKFNSLKNIASSIGMKKCDICTHCFDGSSYGDK